MPRRRVGRHIGGGQVPEDEQARLREQEALREAFSRWATGVCIVAVRADGRVHALTVSAFIPVSVDPPLILVSLGPNASALPYLEPGTRFGISLLAAGQRGLASRFADVFPVGPSPFSPEGTPLVEDALASLECVVEEVRPAGDHQLITARVAEAFQGGDAPALIYFRRQYHRAG